LSWADSARSGRWSHRCDRHLQTFAVAVDYSLLDLLRTAGIAVARASPIDSVDQARHGGTDRPVSDAGAGMRSCGRASIGTRDA
jgi:hypothetical protein